MKSLLRSLVFLLLILCGLNAHAGTYPTKYFVIAKDQLKLTATNTAPWGIFLKYKGPVSFGASTRKDTIIDLKTFLDSLKLRRGIPEYNYLVLFQQDALLDSFWTLDQKMRVRGRAVNLKGSARKATAQDYLRVSLWDSAGRRTNEFFFDLHKSELIGGRTRMPRNLEASFLWERHIFPTGFPVYGRLPAVYILSIGIDNYDTHFTRNCISDATAYKEYFQKLTRKQISDDRVDLFHSYLLTDSQATKSHILQVLREIANKAQEQDIFVFNFTGQSNYLNTDSTRPRNYFFPWDIKGRHNDPSLRNPAKGARLIDGLLSLQQVQEFVQQIAAQRQLLISESGPSGAFRQELLRTVLREGKEQASILNKSRVIIVPNQFGEDVTRCGDSLYAMGPIAYALTHLSLESPEDFFIEGKQHRIELALQTTLAGCRLFNEDYLSVLFERSFLKQYQDIFSDDATRGVKKKQDELK
ncbi:MAG: hypothetical protein EOP50_05705, partial [Sphingobacteriales bacterium]